MTVPLMLQLQVQEKVQQCLVTILGEEAAKYFSIVLSFKSGMKTVAGQAYFDGSNLIELNQELFLANQGEFFDCIIAHEVAHILQFTMYPDAKRHHGKEWKKIMKLLSVNPEPYHNLDVSAVDSRFFRYSCSCGLNHSLTKHLHEKTQSGKVALCASCETRLIYFPYGDSFS